MIGDVIRQGRGPQPAAYGCGEWYEWQCFEDSRFAEAKRREEQLRAEEQGGPEEDPIAINIDKILRGEEDNENPEG